ncbi:MAG TPA: T9SS type A sorting domain-containing protein [Puia sp.]|jgi:hypothetical protein|nr:T9SS type A sorting domain-containing protein [Puia sp.]
MKKLTWLILLATACCGVGRAQQPAPGMPDSVTDSAGSLRALGGLLFVNFTATLREANKVVLQWDTDSAAQGDYFIIERSPDASHYETIGVVSTLAGTGHYELTDGAAPNGSNFYRIKYEARTGAPVYSKTMQLSLSGVVDFKFYPNPVDKLFIVRTEHTIDLQIIDAAGAVRLGKRLQAGIQVINVSSLEKGVYILRVTDKESNRAISQQLLKN